MKKFPLTGLSLLLAFGVIVPNYSLAQNANGNNDAVTTAPTTRPRIAPPLTNEQIIELLRAPIEAIPSVRGIVTYPEDNSIISVYASRKIDLRLDSISKLLNRPRANRQREIQKFVGIIRDSIQKNDPFKTEALRVIVRETSALNDFENETAINGIRNQIVRRVLVGNIEEAIVADSPTSMAIMPIGRLKDLELEESKAFEIAKANTREYAIKASWLEKDGLLEVKLDGAYEASLLAIDDIWDSIEKHFGGPIAIAIPNRGALGVGRADSPADLAKLREMATRNFTGPHAISNKIYFRRNNAWVEQ